MENDSYNIEAAASALREVRRKHPVRALPGLDERALAVECCLYDGV